MNASPDDNALQPESAVQNRNIGAILAQQNTPLQPSRRRTKVGKSHVDYWKARLIRRPNPNAGEAGLCNVFVVRIFHEGRREYFSTHTLNKDVGAAKAKEIYEAIVHHGWEVALLKYKPKAEVPAACDRPSVGDLLQHVEKKSGLNAKTFRQYASSLRQIVAEIHGIDGGKEKFDYRTGGVASWRGKVDAVEYGSITAEQVQAWKVARLRQFSANPEKLQSARRTVNAYLRGARSLIAAAKKSYVPFTIPMPSSFHAVDLEPNGSTRYVSTIDVRALVAAARAELKAEHRESYKMFLLGLFGGLRRAEIDGLEWRHIDDSAGVIRLVNTDVLKLKSDDSLGIVEIDSEVVQELLSMRTGSCSRFVVESHLQPRPGLDRQYYRCEPHFQHLLGWLRSKGVKTNKPLHALRKEFGSLINQKYGLHAAATALRHADTSTSARHYVSKKERLSLGLGGLLKDTPPPTETSQPVAV
jgi:integrase